MLPSKLRPDEVTKIGWYWFRADVDSPKAIRRGVDVVVLVSISRSNGSTVVCFPQGTYRCCDLGGQFYGPLESPFAPAC